MKIWGKIGKKTIIWGKIGKKPTGNSSGNGVLIEEKVRLKKKNLGQNWGKN